MVDIERHNHGLSHEWPCHVQTDIPSFSPLDGPSGTTYHQFIFKFWKSFAGQPDYVIPLPNRKPQLLLSIRNCSHDRVEIDQTLFRPRKKQQWRR